MESLNNNEQRNIRLNLSGYRDQKTAELVGNNIGAVIRALAEQINLINLDGVTVSYDYEHALASLDRGVETLKKLTPSSGDVVGVAMTPMVIRDGEIKNHIVINAAFIEGILSNDYASEEFNSALAIIAHECAHVSNGTALNKSFPGRILQHTYSDIHDYLRGECWLSVMEEYCATRLSSGIGLDNAEMYLNSFCNQAEKLKRLVNTYIVEYRRHGVVDRVLNEVYNEITNTLKLAAYYLGDCAAKGIGYKNESSRVSALEPWLLTYIEKLNSTCDEIYQRYGEWKSVNEMEPIADILDEVACQLGMIVSKREQGIWVNIP
ncbi:hypothetical protein [Pseudescherichia sp.]|uniref:hypothetical protein n=1 Tax=Pseudescherichia sp. TaxID=2055881 RepID=UPI0028A91F25|nr:hypothetical protein [Pseudescherichia sp.]